MAVRQWHLSIRSLHIFGAQMDRFIGDLTQTFHHAHNIVRHGHWYFLQSPCLMVIQGCRVVIYTSILWGTLLVKALMKAK